MSREKFIRSALVSALALLLTAGTAFAATTIGANIVTNGTLQVDGTSTLGGNVSIGTGTEDSGNLTVGENTNTGLTIASHGTGIAVPQLKLQRTDGTFASKSAVKNGDDLGEIQFLGYFDTLAGVGGDIEVDATQDWSNGGAGGASMRFQTLANGQFSPAVALTLNQDQTATFTGLTTAPRFQANNDGSASTTAFGFTNDPTLGFWRGPRTNTTFSSANDLHASGRMDFDSTGTTFNHDLTIIANTGSPDFGTQMSFRTNTTSSDQTVVASINSGDFEAADGTAGFPGLTFNSDVTLGMYKAATNDLGFSTNSVKRLDISTTAMTSAVHLKSSGPTSTNAGTGTCTSVTVSGTDTRGSITATCTAGQTVIMNFGTAYGTAPVCTISPANAAASVATSGIAFASASTSALTLTSPTAATGGIWNYVCIE
jgi:hypothetical protein